MAWAVVGAAAVTTVGGWALNKYGGGSASGSSAGAGAADPFASQRPQYQSKLADLVNNPSSIETNPLYASEYKLGLDTVNRGAAASGLLNSGNRLAALSDYGAHVAGSAYQQQFNNLATLAGATSGSPGTAGQIIQGQSNRNQDALGAFGNLVVKGGKKWWDSSGEGSGSGGSGGSAGGDTPTWAQDYNYV